MIQLPGNAWHFAESRMVCPGNVRDALYHARVRSEARDVRDRQQGDWIRPRRLPGARMITPGRRQI